MNIENYSDSTPIQISFGDGLRYRKIYYRINPSVLPFWTRIFKNPWKCLKRASFGTWDYYFESRDYNIRFSKYKTLGEVREYLRIQQKFFDDFTEANGDNLWPDEK